MAEQTDVNEMFQKMGEKLGWFKNKTEAKQKLLLSNRKKTNKKKDNTEAEDSDFKQNGKTAEKLKLKKKKTTVENKATSEQKSKTESKPKHTSSHFKAQTFQVLASSDSDSSFTDVPKHKGKKFKTKAVLQMCSDSDDDFAPTSNIKNDFAKKAESGGNSDACIKESFVDSMDGENLSDRIQLPKFEPILNIEPKRQPSLDYNDTVVKNRVSLASCSLDLDNLGEPLVESTRIHRRSSVTYKHLMEGLESSPEDIKEADDARNVEKESVKKIDEMLDLEDSVCDETNHMYITAIESVGDTLNSSESNLSSDKLENELEKHDKDKVNEKHDIKTGKEERNMTLDSSESEEEIEVVDCATQTYEVATFDDECIERGKETKKSIHKAYNEKTILDDQGKVYDFDNRCRDTGDTYGEDTVDVSHVNASNNSIHELELSKSRKDLPDIYSGDTIDQLGHTLASTTISTSVHDYSKETIAQENKFVLHRNAYNEITASGINREQHKEENCMNAWDDCNVSAHMSLGEVPEIEINEKAEKYQMNEKGGVNIEDNEKLNVDVSVYEVNDAGTQTEDLDEVQKKADSENEDNKNDYNNDTFDDEVMKNEDDVYPYDDMKENDLKEEIESRNKVKTNIGEDISDESDTSERSQEDKFENISESSDSSDAINASFANHAKKSRSTVINTGSQQKANTTDQSWRSSRKYSSDSSDDGNLEAFFQKLRKPEPEKSPAASPMSMDDFIVEDEDMSSDSDDSGFHLRETHELEKRNDMPQRLLGAPTYYSEDDDDESDDFSSKMCPPNVTRQKKQRQETTRKQTNISWSFSSDIEDDTEAKVSRSLEPKKDNKLKDQKSTKSHKNDKKSAINIDFSSDSGSDNEVFDIKSLKKYNNKGGSDDCKTNESSNNISNDKKKIHATSGKSNSLTGLSGSLNDEEPLFKTPNPLRKRKGTSIIDENKENAFKTPVSSKGRESRTPKSTSKPMYISLSDTDSDRDESSDFLVSLSDSSTNSRISGSPVTPLSLKNGSISKATPLSLKYLTTSKSTPVSSKSPSTYSFLRSLSNTTEDSRRHPDAKRFVNNFKKNKEELSAYLFKLYNQNIFDNKLPSDIPVIWNKRLLRTAGYCAYKKNSRDDRDRSTRIELSVKVCDNAERVRDTLIHEMCHAAVWLLNGINGGHGSYWKYWARHATRVHPELPAVSVCHSYSINTKFTYRCKSCGYSIGRHSKSLDVKKKVCGYCRGEFELIQNSVPTTPTSAASSTSSTPRPPNKFAMFVKDNYNSVKRKNQDLKHGDVMKELSKLFAESKIAT